MEETVKKRSSLATAGLVLGIIALVFSVIPIIRFVSYPFGILGIVFGLVCLITKKSKATAIIALILGILSIFITVTLQQATVNAIDEALNEVSENLEDVTGDNTDELLEKYVDVTIGEFTVKKDEILDSYKLPVTVKNKGKEKSSFSIKIEAVDSSGKRIDDDTVLVDSLNAGQSQDVEAFTLITEETANKLKNATFKIVEVSKY